MAAPAIAAAVKAAAAVLSNEKTRKAVGWIIAAILSPVILLIVVIVTLLGGTSQHNNSAVELSFNGGYMSSSTLAEFRLNVEDMHRSFAGLDGTVDEINAMTEDGSVDGTRVKAVYFALFFAQSSSADAGLLPIASCGMRKGSAR
jgi:hypothetical protein